MNEMSNIFYCVVLIFACDRLARTWSLKTNSISKICEEEKSTTLNGTFEWKLNYNDHDDDNDNDVNYVISQPDVCWYNDSVVLRQCDFEKGIWLPQHIQCEKFPSRNNKCSDDLTELFVNNEYVCLKISTKKQSFDEHFCYGSNFVIGHNKDSIDWEILKFTWEKYKITSFWLPVKRYQENDFDPFVIRLPGKQWNELYVRGETAAALALSADNQTLSGKHCLAAFIQPEIGKQNQAAFEMKMTHCSDLHYSLCVIKKYFVAKSGCPQDFGALSHRPNECYGITWDGQKYPQDYRMLNANEYFKKINTINIIFEELDIANDKFVQIAGDREIPRGKWAIQPKNNQIKIVSARKKLHGLCVEYIESRKNVEMMLRMDSELDALILTVYNKFYIWSNNKPEHSIHCFTNADYAELMKVELKKIWENDAQTKTIFKLSLKSDDPGQYWCEAHTIFNFSHVMSQKVIAAKAKRGHAFALQIKVPLQHYLIPIIFTADQMKHMAACIKKDIKNVLKNQRHLNELVIHNVRIMDILYIAPNASYLRCICHVSVSIKSSLIDTSKEQISQEDNSVEDGDGLTDSTAVRMKAKSLLINLMKEFQPHFQHTVSSTEYCFPENEWLLARIGQTATKSKLCLQANGLPMSRKCLGDFINGAQWEELSTLLEACPAYTDSSELITSHLYSIEKSTAVKELLETNVKEVRKLLQSNMENLIPADLYYLAKIMRHSVRGLLKTSRQTQSPTMDTFKINHRQWTFENFSDTTVEIVQIINQILEVHEHVIRPSIQLNSTNVLLDSFEHLVDQFSLVETFSSANQSSSPESQMVEDDSKDIEIIEYLDVGVIVKVATNFVAFIITPQVANVTGVALYRAQPSSSSDDFNDEGLLRGAFKNEFYRFILANQSALELLNEQNILMGTYVPSSLWQRLDEISIMSNTTRQTQFNETKVVVKIYANDKLFQERNLTSVRASAVVGRVVSISIPGHDKDLPETLPLILNVHDLDNSNNTTQQIAYCRYWNYQTWASDGVMVLNRSEINNNTLLCGCTHLTPFAYLIGGGSYKLSVDSEVEFIVKKIHRQALDIITLLGCSLTLFGIAGIFVTACTFPSWRQKANSKVLLQLSAAIALQMILFCFVNTEENSSHLIRHQIYNSCIAIGACLHYSVLVQFCWMFIIAYLQFKRYVQVFGNTRPKRFFIKSTILGWGLPLLPVACVLLFNSDSYIPPQDQSSQHLCYPAGVSFYLSIVLPITVVITANLAIFVVVIYNILRNPAGAIRHTEKSLAISQIRLLVLLFFLLGFTWIFGLLNAMKAGLLFSYLFCLTATLQGFILFVYFIVMDPVTRRMWQGYFAKICGLKPGRENSSSLKETTQSF